MGMTLSSGNVTANVVSNAANFVSVIPLFASRTSAGTTTMGTVPANKRWRITSAMMMVSISGAAQLLAYLKANGVEICGCLCNATATANNSNSVSIVWDLTACPTITAGQTLTLVTDNTQYGQAYVTYYEESV